MYKQLNVYIIRNTYVHTYEHLSLLGRTAKHLNVASLFVSFIVVLYQSARDDENDVHTAEQECVRIYALAF